MKTKLMSWFICFVFLIAIFGFVLGECGLINFNPIARKLGGTIEVELEPNRKLIDANWKGQSLWIITREMKEDEKPETYTYEEDSTYGVLEGKVVITETR